MSTFKDIDRIVEGVAAIAASVPVEQAQMQSAAEAIRSIGKEHRRIDARHAAMERRVGAKLRSGVRKTSHDPV